MDNLINSKDINKYQDTVEMKSVIEISKTEYIYDEDIVRTAVYLEDYNHTNYLQQTQNNVKDRQELHTEGHQLKLNSKADGKETKNHKCKICSMSFTTNFQLNIHVNIHNLERPYSCSLCEKSYKLEMQLVKHRNIEHQQFHKKDLAKRYACEICTRSFPHAGELKIHIKLHTDECPFKCEVCSKPFAYNAEYTRHLKSHSRERPFSCSICGKNYKHERHLKIHERIHITDTAREEKITGSNTNICSKQTTSKLEVVNDIDLNSKDVQCSSTSNATKDETNNSVECLNDLDHKDQIIFKIKEDTDDNREESYMDRDYLTDSQYNNVLEVTKTEYMITNQNILYSDIDGDHGEEFKETSKDLPKSHSCEFCSKLFSKSYNLKLHLRVHTGERPFACSFCDKAYKQRHPLKLHEKIHLEQKDKETKTPKESKTKKSIYKCEFCSRLCPNITELKRHLKVHTGERPFACSLCEQTYKCEDHLKNHQKIHAELKPKTL